MACRPLGMTEEPFKAAKRRIVHRPAATAEDEDGHSSAGRRAWEGAGVPALSKAAASRRPPCAGGPHARSTSAHLPKHLAPRAPGRESSNYVKEAIMAERREWEYLTVFLEACALESGGKPPPSLCRHACSTSAHPWKNLVPGLVALPPGNEMLRCAQHDKGNRPLPCAAASADCAGSSPRALSRDRRQRRGRPRRGI